MFELVKWYKAFDNFVQFFPKVSRDLTSVPISFSGNMNIFKKLIFLTKVKLMKKFILDKSNFNEKLNLAKYFYANDSKTLVFPQKG